MVEHGQCFQIWIILFKSMGQHLLLFKGAPIIGSIIGEDFVTINKNTTEYAKRVSIWFLGQYFSNLTCLSVHEDMHHIMFHLSVMNFFTV